MRRPHAHANMAAKSARRGPANTLKRHDTFTCASAKLHILRARPLNSSGCPSEPRPRAITTPRETGRTTTRSDAFPQPTPGSAAVHIERTEAYRTDAHPPDRTWRGFRSRRICAISRGSHPATLRILAPCSPARMIAPRLRRRQRRLARVQILLLESRRSASWRRPSFVGHATRPQTCLT